MDFWRSWSLLSLHAHRCRYLFASSHSCIFLDSLSPALHSAASGTSARCISLASALHSAPSVRLPRFPAQNACQSSKHRVSAEKRTRREASAYYWRAESAGVNTLSTRQPNENLKILRPEIEARLRKLVRWVLDCFSVKLPFLPDHSHRIAANSSIFHQRKTNLQARHLNSCRQASEHRLSREPLLFSDSLHRRRMHAQGH